MTTPTALLITDRVLDGKRSPGMRWRVASLKIWLAEAGFEAVHHPVTPSQSIAKRFVATIGSVRALKQRSEDFDLVVVYAMNAPHMVWLGGRLGGHGAVIVDLCDSLTLWKDAVQWRIEPFFRFKLWLSGLLLRTQRGGIVHSYVTARDAQADSVESSIVIPNSVPKGLGDELDVFLGPPDRVVIAADVEAVQNVQALTWFADAVRSGELELRVPVEIYGPTAPSRELPPNVVYKGWAPHLRDIYKGRTAVFAPTVRGAGIQNKYLEAVAAGRPVAIGRQPSEAIPDYDGALTFVSKAEMVKQLYALQNFSGTLRPGDVSLAPDRELLQSMAVAKALAARRHKRR